MKSENIDKLTNKHIDISKDDEIVHWSKLLCCTEEDLIQALIAIGNSASMVDCYLQLNRKKNE